MGKMCVIQNLCFLSLFFAHLWAWTPAGGWGTGRGELSAATKMAAMGDANPRLPQEGLLLTVLWCQT